MSRDPKSTYYDAGGIPTQDIIKAKLTPEQYEGYLLGNIIKYSCRMNFKTPGQLQRDAEKTGHYATWLQNELDARNTPNQPELVAAIDVTTTEQACTATLRDETLSTRGHLDYVQPDDGTTGYWRMRVCLPPHNAGEYRFYVTPPTGANPYLITMHPHSNAVVVQIPETRAETLRALYKSWHDSGVLEELYKAQS